MSTHAWDAGSLRLVALGYGRIDQLPYALRRQRKLAWLDAKRRQRGRDRIRDHAANRNDAALPRALGTQWIIGRWLVLERNRSDVRKIARGRQQIIRKRTGQQLAMLVIDKMLQEGPAKALHD